MVFTDFGGTWGGTRRGGTWLVRSSFLGFLGTWGDTAWGDTAQVAIRALRADIQHARSHIVGQGGSLREWLHARFGHQHARSHFVVQGGSLRKWFHARFARIES